MGLKSDLRTDPQTIGRLMKTEQRTVTDEEMNAPFETHMANFTDQML